MTVSAPVNNKEEFLSNFLPQDFPGNPELIRIKEEAEKALQELDFPTTRDEQWKYTKVTRILKKKYTQYPLKADPKHFFSRLASKDCHLFVFINGFFSSELSHLEKEKGAVILPLSMARKIKIPVLEKQFASLADHKNQIFTALNTVFHTNGAFIFLEENVVLKKPVHILNFLSGNAAFNPRNLVVLSKNSAANITASFENIDEKPGHGFVNVVTEIFLREEAKLSFHIIQNEKGDSGHINSTFAGLNKGSNAEFFTVSTGPDLLRNNLKISLDGENSAAHLFGIYSELGIQHMDNHTLIEHKKPNTLSTELYKGIMNEKSAGVFNGKVLVFRDAQKTNAYQSNQNILLSDDASVDSKPELEIYADDVKCSHGSTTGKLDEEAIFYLCSRGISAEKAKKMLLHAFAGEVIEKISYRPVKKLVSALIEESLV